MLVEGDSLWIAAGWDALPDDRWPQMEPGDDLFLPLEGAVSLLAGWQLAAGRLTAAPAEFNPGTDPMRVTLIVPEDIQGFEVRARRRGDRFRPFGMGGSRQKVSDFMINRSMPKRLRARWPLVCLDDEIIWIPGYAISHRFRVGVPAGRMVELICSKVNPGS